VIAGGSDGTGAAFARDVAASGINLLLDVISTGNILFGSEMVGAVRGVDPQTGHYFDDTKKYVDAIETLSDADRTKIFEGNALRAYPRLKSKLRAKAAARA